MIKIPIEQIEIPLKIKLRRNWTSFGSDTASCTGWAKSWTDDEYFYCEYGVIDAKSSTTNKRYKILMDFFMGVVDNSIKTMVVEKPFLKYFFVKGKRSPQVNVFRVLVSIAMIPFFVGLTKGMKESAIKMIEPSKSRASLNLNARDSKEKIQIQFMIKTGIEVAQNDAMDAVILAINGLLVGNGTIVAHRKSKK